MGYTTIMGMSDDSLKQLIQDFNELKQYIIDYLNKTELKREDLYISKYPTE